MRRFDMEWNGEKFELQVLAQDGAYAVLAWKDGCEIAAEYATSSAADVSCSARKEYC
jgi:hypothetical protein